MRDRDKVTIIYIVIVAIIFIMTLFAAIARENRRNEILTAQVELTARNGDTLWGYWCEYGGGIRYDKWLYDVKRLNGMEQSGLAVGQVIKVLEVAR